LERIELIRRKNNRQYYSFGLPLQCSAHPDRRGPAHLSLSARDKIGEAFSPVGTGELPAKSDKWAAGGRRWSGRGASRWGDGPVWRPKRGVDLTRRLLCGGGDRRQAGVGVLGGVRAVGEDVLGGVMLGVGSRWSEDDWSRLSAVVWFDRRGTAVVERRSTRGHRQGGRGSSRRRCGAQGDDGEFGGGSGLCFMMAQ
jgi:hypothetical protein